MSNKFIPAADVGKEIWAIFERVADKHGLDNEGRAKVLDLFSAAAFYEPTFRGSKK